MKIKNLSFKLRDNSDEIMMLIGIMIIFVIVMGFLALLPILLYARYGNMSWFLLYLAYFGLLVIGLLVKIELSFD